MYKDKDWSEIFKKYKGLWVALAEDETTVIAYSKEARKAYQEAVEKGVSVPIMLNVPIEFKSHVDLTCLEQWPV